VVGIARTHKEAVALYGKTHPKMILADIQLADGSSGIDAVNDILSTEADFATMLDTVPSPANGMTLCSGSLGSRPDNDLPGMMRRLGDKVHFLHLRNVRRDTPAL
jgi:D-mannonate dehydratase